MKKLKYILILTCTIIGQAMYASQASSSSPSNNSSKPIVHRQPCTASQCVCGKAVCEGLNTECDSYGSSSSPSSTKNEIRPEQQERNLVIARAIMLECKDNQEAQGLPSVLYNLVMGMTLDDGYIIKTVHTPTEQYPAKALSPDGKEICVAGFSIKGIYDAYSMQVFESMQLSIGIYDNNLQKWTQPFLKKNDLKQWSSPVMLPSGNSFKAPYHVVLSDIAHFVTAIAMSSKIKKYFGNHKYFSGLLLSCHKGKCFSGVSHSSQSKKNEWQESYYTPLLHPYHDESIPIITVALSLDSNITAGALEDNTISINPETSNDNAQIVMLEGHDSPATALAISGSNKRIASATAQEIKIWNIADHQPCLITFGQGIGATQTLAFSPNGRALASGYNDGKIRIWNSSTGKLLATLEGHASPIRSLAMPKNKTIVALSDDGTVNTWKITYNCDDALELAEEKEVIQQEQQAQKIIQEQEQIKAQKETQELERLREEAANKERFCTIQ